MEIEVLFDKTDIGEDLRVGLISQTSWEGLLPFLNQCFLIRKYESIVGIVVTETGISAKIKTT